MTAAAPNKILFERANIKITETRFETGFETFPIKKISGVRIDVEKRNTHIGIPLALVGLAALFAGALSNFPVFIVSGAAFIVGGAMLCLGRVRRSVVLTSRGRDIKVVTSKDAALIQAIMDALQDALSRRA
ncbi:MAG: DUF6232 family protein [Burkholderiales bacterium]|nr:DUF6232 family protein [Burkholderiales bacterium]